MKISLTLSALALSVLPAVAFAGCSDKVKTDSAASCMPGYAWDTATSSCTASPST